MTLSCMKIILCIVDANNMRFSIHQWVNDIWWQWPGSVLGRGNVTDTPPIQIKRAVRQRFNLNERYLYKPLHKTVQIFLLLNMNLSTIYWQMQYFLVVALCNKNYQTISGWCLVSTYNRDFVILYRYLVILLFVPDHAVYLTNVLLKYCIKFTMILSLNYVNQYNSCITEKQWNSTVKVSVQSNRSRRSTQFRFAH